jgi:exodeoxyribonuclease VII large subunit
MQRRLDNLDSRARRAIASLFESRQHQLILATEKVRLLSPLAPLDRGWAIVRRDSGAVIRSVGDVAPSDLVTIRLRDGTVRARVETGGPDSTPPSPQAPEDSPFSQDSKEQR